MTHNIPAEHEDSCFILREVETQSRYTWQMADAAAVAALGRIKSSCAIAMSAPILRILVILPSGIIDFLNTLPALYALRESFPAARICAVVTESLRELVEELPDVDDVWSQTRQNLSSQAMLLRHLRQEHFDLAISFSISRHASLLAFVSGAPRRAGFANTRWEPLLNHIVNHRDVPNRDGSVLLVQSLGCRSLQVEQRNLLQIPPAALREVDKWATTQGIKSTFVVIALHHGVPKNGDQLRWEQTVELLSQKTPVVIIGAIPTQKWSVDEQIFIYDVPTKWANLAALCGRAQVVIGTDRAVLHLAAYLDTPVVCMGDNNGLEDKLPRGTIYRSVPFGANMPLRIDEAARDVVLQFNANQAKARAQHA